MSELCKSSMINLHYILCTNTPKGFDSYLSSMIFIILCFLVSDVSKRKLHNCLCNSLLNQNHDLGIRAIFLIDVADQPYKAKSAKHMH